MKRIIFLLTFILLTFFTNLSYSQCTNTTYIGNSTVYELSIGQSFKPTCSGKLTTIGIVSFTSSSDVTVTLYNGEGPGGIQLAQLTSQSTSLANDMDDFSNSTFDFSGLGVTLTSGNSYTVIVAGPSGGHAGLSSYGNQYGNGKLYLNGVIDP